MQLTTVLAILAAASTSFAAPTPGADSVSMMDAGASWTMQSFKRVCNAASTSCAYSWSINLNNGTPATPCAYTVTGNPAQHATYENVKCGAFVVGSTWSGQFGAGHGFQTLSVVKGNQIIYPAYTDTQLQGGKVVSPNQSYTPQNIPS